MNLAPPLSPGNLVVRFLRTGGLWTIGDGRAKAREACIDFLTRVPEDARRFIMEERGIFLLAPPRKCPGMSMPYVTGVPLGQTAVRFAVIYLDAQLETIPVINTLVVLATCVANAIQARPVWRMTAESPEALLRAWGFEAEVEKTRRRGYGCG